MGNVKDAVDLGIEAIQFWMRFKGRRVRIWPSQLTISVCSQSRRMRVTSAERKEPRWWEASRLTYEKNRRRDPLLEFATTKLEIFALPNIEVVDEARLFEATIADIIKTPPGIYLTDIEYWMATEKSLAVVKVASVDEGMLLPLENIARIDFVPAEPGQRLPEKSSWK